IVPWQQLCKMTGATLKFIPVDAKTGKLDLSSLDSLLSPKVKMVTLTHMSNMLGTVNPVKEVAKRAHEAGALCFVDAAQSVPHMPVDVQDLGCDFLAFSGHKMLGPTGIGVLYGREEVLTKMRPFLFGGEMIKRVTLAESRFNDLPWKFEAGTPVIAEGVGLAAAIDYLNALGMDWVARHERELARYAFKRLAEVPDVTIYGPGPDERGGVVAFNLGSVHPHDLSSLLDDEGVAIRAGDHCTQPLHIKLGIPASARASFYVYNTPSEIDALAAALEKAHAIFGG
ncbi:MAG: aminotransferase class V-fold PLP-dependent enzyme, partial [Methanobacteriota archaeon]